MRKIFAYIKHLLQGIFITLLALYTLLYIVLSLPIIQDSLRNKGESLLSATLNVPLKIGRIEFSPFDRIELYNVVIPDQDGDTLLYSGKVAAGIDLWELTQKQIRLHNVQLFGLDARIKRNTADSPTNLQFIIDAFSSKRETPKNPIDLEINSALIRRGRIRYDVLSEPHKNIGTLDPHHIDINNFLATIAIDKLQKDSIDIFIKRLSFKEKSGFQVNNFVVHATANKETASISQFLLKLPHSQIKTKDAIAHIDILSNLSNIPDSTHINLALTDTRITLSDIAAIVPALQYFHSPIEASCVIDGNFKQLNIKNITFNLDKQAVLLQSALSIKNLLHNDSLQLQFDPIKISSQPHGAALIGKNMGITQEKTIELLQNLGAVRFDGRISGSMPNAKAYGLLSTDIGDVQTDISIHGEDSLSQFHCYGYIGTDGLDLNRLLGEESKLGTTAFDLKIDSRVPRKGLPRGKLIGKIDRIDYNKYSYNDIDVNAQFSSTGFDGKLQIDDPNGFLSVDGIIQLKGRNTLADVIIKCKDVDLEALNLVEKYQGYKLNFDFDAEYTGNRLDNANGYIQIDSITFGNEKELLQWDNICVIARNDTYPQKITINSDYINGSIEGEYTFSSLSSTFNTMLSSLVPAVIEPQKKSYKHSKEATPSNNFDIQLVISPNVEMAQILDLPFAFTDKAYINGYVHDLQQRAHLDALASNIWLGNKHIQDFTLSVNQSNKKLQLSAQASLLNKKKIPTIWNINSSAYNNNIDIDIHWNTNTITTYCGAIKLNTQLYRNIENNNQLNVDVNIRPTQVIINDTTWEIKPSYIKLNEQNITVNNLEISRPSQHIVIDGVVSKNSEDTMHVDLQDINLDYIFETLNINHVTFGGRATGRVDAADVFTKNPYLCTRKLDIKNFSYNKALFGDLSILGMWNPDNMGILLKGIILGRKNNESYVDGYIYPTKDSLSIAFDVEKVPIKFIRPFVNQILSDVNGEASGQVLLEGHFNRIYLTGEAYAENFSFGVPYLNTQYMLSDSIHFTDHNIWFDDVTVYDMMGNTAQARGEIKHKHFTDLHYDININNTDNLLVFDIPHTPGCLYYGTVLGSGKAAIKGDEHRTDIDVNMTTDEDSKFTFVLTNTEEAADYQFLTFSNQKELRYAVKDTLKVQVDSTVIRNNLLMEKAIQAPTSSTALYITLSVNVTPDAHLTLVMDEVLGDKMQGTGDGTIRLEYNTIEDEIQMFGTYTIGEGRYNFSLQDIITRDFIINSGSKVSFRGSPLDVNLDINATYALQANLADLDESFTTDSELTRTTVPVHTILEISGNMMKPDIGFDISLPTLSADMDSKMRSIISTDDMMTRQIIYLLALNRFFTPEYNASTNGSSEWTSLATSTLTSSIGSLLGQINENWDIAPQVRSSKGDFSDVEVDLMLSSQLLNNRLIFNGNFGYRDKRYNATNFIGDFDIEYLLTENGNLRLKGYNHFNDRNYSMRTALTTQGIGIMYKHDFDSWRNFFDFSFKKNKKPKSEATIRPETNTPETIHPDTIITAIPDMLQ